MSIQKTTTAQTTESTPSFNTTNALIRKNDRAALAKLGMTPEQIEALFKPDFCGRVGFASYQLSNNNANMRRIKERIAILETATKQEDKEIQGNGFTVREDVAENRVMVLFDAKPEKDICRLVSSNGFKWSPTRTAWVRQLNNAGRYAAKCLIEELEKNPQYGSK
jgi:hypothetical protein